MIKAQKGTKDVLPSDSYKWQYLEEKFREVCRLYNLKEIRTPTFEATNLFERSVGDDTDIVQKEMYTFNDKGNRSITLKPEGTAGVVRAFIEAGMINDAQPTKMYYFTPAFRYENVQKGRLREHHQFGVEMYGSSNPKADLEVIKILLLFYKKIGLKNIKLALNNIGCKKCRPNYNRDLTKYLNTRKDDLCPICQDRLIRNPLRVLDCKNKNCQKIVSTAPEITDYVCDECKDHFSKLTSYLDLLEIKYEINPLIVRGLDYYTKVVFEFLNEDGFTLCGGGRYDNMIEELGGTNCPGVGFGMGVERLLLELDLKNIDIPKPRDLDLYIGFIGEKAQLKSLEFSEILREHDLSCEQDLIDRKIKAQMKYANKINSRFVVILGDNEISENKAKFKDMQSGKEVQIKLDDYNKIIKLIKS